MMNEGSMIVVDDGARVWVRQGSQVRYSDRLPRPLPVASGAPFWN